jgi:hypothetical protein
MKGLLVREAFAGFDTILNDSASSNPAWRLAMASSLCSLVVLLSVTSSGGLFDFLKPRGMILEDRPGIPYGFNNGNPDGYGWVDFGMALPLGANRIAEYHFPRYLALPADQMFMPTYYNPYTTRGQRFLPYANCGGEHPAGGPAVIPGNTPVNPYNETLGNGPVRPVPTFGGRVEAKPINPGTSGLRP